MTSSWGISGHGAQCYLQKLLRPWKIATAMFGTAYFVWGAYYHASPTWDVGVSIIMSVACFFLAPLGVDLLVRGHRSNGSPARRVAYLFASAAVIYFVGSGTYELYNTIRMGVHPPTYWENLFFSVPVTIIAGTLWRFDGSLRELLDTIVVILQRADR